ncbi:GNAT family N-acetyltransferase [Acidipropionibacterium jensenii]|uniref:N-acetyltransferase domain-containing protein n=1 Tax=Acidipropionibacterium jensenii TaxID=1749 RepID=A0A448NW81_9ACTN|nr:GNAT family N-acetyltransferase [Acidipropionibacterium jensenii]MDN5995299.1 GNAT family N-acetyltransferase [Acidipropionibacterium jensenii]MDN6425950.1 GNAT family N-acetyltransferase [Acidipropionibacterium jensenii]MDN6440444.1 GNAT family N-acetyltransferase [Acidipropionibacterium jensenii]MDN6479303.1 GNAT family N-acetyltransferase [Acidipropionibacterium jensenii]MDN6511797.1 GNAT family N-acetyltransferase [Acidipropionibacterium jensenii]
MATSLSNGAHEDAHHQGPGRFAVRRAARKDLVEAAAVQALCLREIGESVIPPEALEELTGPETIHATVESWQQLMDAGASFWVIDDLLDMRIVGVALTQTSTDPDAPTPLELSTLHVMPEARTCGASDALIAAAIGDRPAHFWVFKDNLRAQHFLRRHGFEVEPGSTDNSLGGVLLERMVRGEA